MSSFTLRARWVLPIDHPPIEGGFVSVANGMITAVEASKLCESPVVDLGDVVLLPGLVNAHTHLEFSGLSRPLGTPGMSLPAWIRSVIADRGRGNRDAAAAIAAGLRESRDAGVVALGEIATSPAVSYALEGMPQTLLFQEAIGFSAGRVDSVHGEMEQRVTAAGALAGVSPHAPYTVHPRLFDRLVELATARGLPVAMHLAESPEELQLLASGDGPFRELLEERSMWDDAAIPRGTRPLDYLRRLAAAPRSLAIHGNYLDDEEIAFAASHRDSMSVVFCPRTHAYFGHTPYPLPKMLDAGVRMTLGTDSRASNPDLSLLNELRSAAQAFPAIDPCQLLAMATLDGAAALGWESEYGSLSVGKRAKLISLPCGDHGKDPYAAILSGNASATIVGPLA